MNDSIAHQRIKAEEFARTSPRDRPTSLFGYSVETIGRQDAEPLIAAYEWLGNLGRAQLFVGLVSPTRELHGVACFGYGPAGNIRKLLAEPSAYCLERGACVHYAPPNAASFLINSGCKLVHRLTGVALFFAYGDPMAGEYGGVYQAAGWIYLGQGLDGQKDRTHRYFVLPPGQDPNVASNWKTTRELRRKRRLTFDQARALGWEIGKRAGKHVYAIYVGGKPRDRRAWRDKYGGKPYPAPRPELKRKPVPMSVFTVTAPIPDQADIFASRTKF